jgi:hypothetical protein
MRKFWLIASLGLLMSGADAQRRAAGPVLLPLRSGDYVATQAPYWRNSSCRDAPMAYRAVIIRGEPLESPMNGECRYQIRQSGRNTYTARALCNGMDGGAMRYSHTLRYTVLSRTEFVTGGSRFRWCSGR